MEEQHLKAFEIACTALGIIFLVVAGISGYTLVGSFMGSLLGDGQSPLSTDIVQSPTGDMDVRFSLSVKNEGMLETRMRLGVKLLSPDGRVIAEGESSKLVPPGSTDNLTVDLSVSGEDARKYQSGEAQPKFSMFFECRTLSELVGMSVQAEV